MRGISTLFFWGHKKSPEIFWGEHVTPRDVPKGPWIDGVAEATANVVDAK